MVVEYIKYPVKYHSRGTMIVDADGEIVCDVRGWGRFCYMDDGASKQDLVGKFITDAINCKLKQQGDDNL